MDVHNYWEMGSMKTYQIYVQESLNDANWLSMKQWLKTIGITCKHKKNCGIYRILLQNDRVFPFTDIFEHIAEMHGVVINGIDAGMLIK